ncbi:hypothetical protein AMECASPLE_033308 [Ameca splendens]|uniref:Uncharacterized protein n=1 Tax=Ameca splendens TaxID=208324 RepID=A0ABV0ZTV4_9TELE
MSPDSLEVWMVFRTEAVFHAVVQSRLEVLLNLTINQFLFLSPRDCFQITDLLLQKQHLTAGSEQRQESSYNLKVVHSILAPATEQCAIGQGTSPRFPTHLCIVEHPA